MDFILSTVGGLVSLVTLLGVVARLAGPERARRRAAREKQALDSAPAALRPAFERMHWEASVHLVAVTLSAASYGRFRGLWVSCSALATASLGVFSVMLAAESTRDPEKGTLTLSNENIALVGLFFVAAGFFLSITGAIEGSRRRLYRKVFDKLHERKNPDRKLLEEARTRDAHKGSTWLGLGWGLSASLLVCAMGINAGFMGSGTELGGIYARALSFTLIIGVVGTALTSWYLLVQWTRRPLDTMFPSADEGQQESAVGENTAT